MTGFIQARCTVCGGHLNGLFQDRDPDMTPHSCSRRVIVSPDRLPPKPEHVIGTLEDSVHIELGPRRRIPTPRLRTPRLP